MASKKKEEVVVEVVDPQHAPGFGEETGEENKDKKED